METIITVPAVWSDKAKSDTLQCAHRAGFGQLDKLRMITEPEAAAVYTFHQVWEYTVLLTEVLTPGNISYQICP
jgi:molecular chaperone DnaK (HSP70)